MLSDLEIGMSAVSAWTWRRHQRHLREFEPAGFHCGGTEMTLIGTSSDWGMILQTVALKREII
jgi:hypothetical protein